MGMDLGKSLEKEPVICHGVHHSRHGEHGTQEAGREDGSVGENMEK